MTRTAEILLPKHYLHAGDDADGDDHDKNATTNKDRGDYDGASADDDDEEEDHFFDDKDAHDDTPVPPNQALRCQRCIAEKGLGL